MQVFRFQAVALLGCVLTACSQGKKYDDPGPLHEKLTGSVSEAVAEVQAGKYTDACDDRFAALQREIAYQLDLRAPEIQRVANAPPAVRKVPVGNSFFTEHDFVPGANVWVRNSKGWQSLILRYQEIKNQNTNSNWLQLDSAVRGIVIDDRNRTVRGVDDGLDHAAGPVIQDLLLRVKGCRHIACREMELTGPDLSVLARNPHMNNRWLAFKMARTEQEAADARERFYERVSINARRYEFYINNEIRRDNYGDLILPLDPGQLAGSESQLDEYIEGVWRSQRQRLKVKWTVSPLERVFKIMMDLQHPYGRAFVSWNENIVQLYPGTNTRSVAHEIGHVLGFRDTYFTLWNKKTCSYEIEQNRGDLMSSSQSGVVLDEHWAQLTTSYR